MSEIRGRKGGSDDNRNRPPSQVKPEDAADYLAAVLPELARIAGRAGFRDVAFILDMAVEAAGARSRRRGELEPG